MAAAVVLGFRYPWTWAFVLLSKATPGIGVLWFAARREWRSLAIALGVTAAVSLAAAVVAPHYWREWVEALISNFNEPQTYSVPPPAPIRVPLAALLVIWGARTDRPWTVGVGAMLALPIIWPHGLTVALAAIPFLRRGDRAALEPDWKSAANPRTLLICLGVFLGLALLVVLIAPDAVRHLMDQASLRLDPYNRRP
jgi:hypothetical protein